MMSIHLLFISFDLYNFLLILIIFIILNNLNNFWRPQDFLEFRTKKEIFDFYP